MSVRASVVCGLAVIGCAVASAPAYATVYAAQVSDPVDGTDGPSRDISGISTSFDNATGHWVTLVAFYGPASSSTAARLSTGLNIPDNGTCDPSQPAGALRVVGHTDPAQSAGTYYTASSCRHSSQVTTAVQSFNRDRTVLQLTVDDPALVGVIPGTLGSSMLTTGSTPTTFDENPGRVALTAVTDGSTTPPDPAPNVSPTGARRPAKILVRRLGISGGRLDMLASITGRATGTIRGTVRADGHTSPFTVDIARDGTHRAGQLTQIRLDRRIAGLSSSARTGIVTLTYAGNPRVRPDNVRLRAASGHAELHRSTSSITSGGDLIVIGTTSRDAVGVVRVRMGYTDADGSVHFVSKNATIQRGATRGIWSVRTRLPARARQAGGELSIQYTGYLPRHIRGEQLAKQVGP